MGIESSPHLNDTHRYLLPLENGGFVGIKETTAYLVHDISGALAYRSHQSAAVFKRLITITSQKGAEINANTKIVSK